MSYNLTEIHEDWKKWEREHDPLFTNETLRSEIVSLCNRVSIKVMQKQEGYIQARIKKLCARALEYANAQASTASAIPSSPSEASKAPAPSGLRQSSSSQSGSSEVILGEVILGEVILLLCLFYVLNRLLQTLAQRRPMWFGMWLLLLGKTPCFSRILRDHFASFRLLYMADLHRLTASISMPSVGRYAHSNILIIISKPKPRPKPKQREGCYGIKPKYVRWC